MVADRNLEIYMEKNSLKFARPLTESIWAAAQEIGVKEFIPREKHEILDDHIPLNEIAGIPTIDIIDFDYPYWHKRNDLPAACSGDSLAKVGRVLLAWLQRPE
jgi:glutaminyl-peptide cyclotransferase